MPSETPKPTPRADDAAQWLDERETAVLRWRCRRGLVENDLFIERFFNRHGQRLSTAQARGIARLMDLSDNDLLDLLLARKEPSGDLDTEEVRMVLAQMRSRP
ncbi:succinate dehydrogenase assembly factor 2 [Melaminivora alkalimesophila]|uniref:FAD assembly factor SdhE n=1 Tax=Melaminivora alkalimesophila TaxID=1165852 RepID=A0A317R8V6_9BURK|nr:succinate dehydrogenase assembly factor 2 [Melaminivora alkalimesophila]PWW44581.1 antitoxin CptB [Melaminivora alkalimesophila]